MTDFPTQDGFFPPGAANVGPVRAGQRQFYDAVRQLPGAKAPATLTIATGAVTPTQGIHAIDTEGAASADDLANILQDNLPDGSLLILLSVDAARVPTVKHSAGGAGQVLLANAADFPLTDPSIRLLLRRDGATWVEEGRFYGADMAGARAYLGTAEAPTAPLTDNRLIRADGTAGRVQDSGWTMGDDDVLDAGGNTLRDAVHRAPRDTDKPVSSVGGVLTIDYDDGPGFILTLNEAITTFTVQNLPTGGAYFYVTVTQDAATKYAWDLTPWDSGDAGALDLPLGSKSILSFLRPDSATYAVTMAWQKSS